MDGLVVLAVVGDVVGGIVLGVKLVGGSVVIFVGGSVVITIGGAVVVSVVVFSAMTAKVDK